MKFFVVTLIVFAALVACLLDVVSANHDYYATAYEIARATRDQRTLEDEHRQLLIDRAALLDPGRLTPIAARHGLKVATADQIVLVGQAPAPASAAAAAPGSAPVGGAGKGQ